MDDCMKGSVLKQVGSIDEFFINRIERRYKLNSYQNSVGRKLKQTGEYTKMPPMTEYQFFDKGVEHFLVYTYLCGLMIKDPQGGYKTLKTKYIIKEMEMKFGYRFSEQELYSAYEYLIRNNYLYEIWDGVKFPGGLNDKDCQLWITAPEVIFTFEAMMQEKERKNKRIIDTE